MVVWGYPCESKSSPAHYSKAPQRGAFFMPVKTQLNIKLIDDIIFNNWKS